MSIGMSGCIHEWVAVYVNEWMYKWMSGCISEWVAV